MVCQNLDIMVSDVHFECPSDTLYVRHHIVTACKSEFRIPIGPSENLSPDMAHSRHEVQWFAAKW